MESSASHPVRSAFRYPSLYFFLAARFLLTAALEMQSVAVGWHLYEITHRPLDLGLAGLAQFLPSLLLFLVGGHVADRFSRRRVLMACYAGFALCALALLLLHDVERAAPIYAVLVGVGLVRVFNSPATQAFGPLLVPPEFFATAAAWYSTASNTANICGPVVGGLLYALYGSPAPVYLTAAVAMLLSLALLFATHTNGTQQFAQRQDWSTVLDGFRYVWRNKLILGSTTLDLFAVLLGGATALLPVFARDILHAGPRGLGLLRAAPGLGAACMALLLANRPLRQHAGQRMLHGVALFGAATLVFGLSHNLALSMLALFVVGASDMVSVLVRATLVQLATPDEMRGRVSAVTVLFIGASNEFGQFESGLTAQWFGAIPAVVAGGLGTLVIVSLWTMLFPGLRRVDQLTPEAIAAAARQTQTLPHNAMSAS